MSATILYISTVPGDRVQALKLAGIRRYADVRGFLWYVSEDKVIPV